MTRHDYPPPWYCEDVPEVSAKLDSSLGLPLSVIGADKVAYGYRTQDLD